MKKYMKKILIIEDDPVIATIYRNRLNKDGFEVEVAGDGQTGFCRTHETLPDAILLNWMLPQMEGLEILKKIRAQKQFQKTPIIVYTSAYLPDVMEATTDAGATQFFNKADSSPLQVIEALHLALSPKLLSTPPSSLQTTEKLPALSAAARMERDEKFLAEMLRAFFDSVPTAIHALRDLVHRLVRSSTNEDRQALLLDLHRDVHSITEKADLLNLEDITQMSAVLEPVLLKMHKNPSLLTSSTTRTLTHAIDFMAELLNKKADLGLLRSAPVRVLVVDDEAVSLRSVCYQLDKTRLQSEGVEDPLAANKMAAEKNYDLIILDVQMPHLNGYELCAKLRALPTHRYTPVLFVSGGSDFDTRVRARLSGGDGFIGKSFAFLELALQALMSVLKHRIALANL